jgi:predicted NAD/FAD-dependent oxidoreductase
MTNFRVHLADGRTATVRAEGLHLDHGALVFDAREGPVVFPARSWSLAHPAGTQILWTPAPAPGSSSGVALS